MDKSKFFISKIKNLDGEFIEKYLEKVYHSPDTDNRITKLDLLDIMVNNFIKNNNTKINILKYLIF